MTKLSVVIITKNEAHNIERCIKSCLPLNAEIIVLDSHSTDSTVSIAEGLGAKVQEVDWQGYGATKNYGAELAQHDWILSLDADEALSELLQESILAALESPDTLSGYWIRRSLVFLGKTLLHGAVRYESRLRLYDKNYLLWNLKRVHENLVPKENESPSFGILKGSLHHYSYTDLTDMKERMDKYARLSAKGLQTESSITLYTKRFLNPIVSFIKNYIINIGFADGKLGYVFAREQASYVYKKYNYALKNQSLDRG